MTAAHDADARLRALYEREWAWRREQFAGADEEDIQALPADHLPQVDPAAQEEREHYWEEVLRQLDALPVDDLSAEARIHHAVFRAQIDELLTEQRFRSWEMPFNSDTAFWTNLGYTARCARHHEFEYTQYLGQLRDIPRYFEQHIANMRAGLARGFSAPRSTLAGIIESVAAVTAAADARDSLFYGPFKQMPAGIPPDRQQQLGEDATQVITHEVVPAHARLLAFLRDEYRPRARTSLAARDLPDGEAWYQAQIRRFTTLDMSARDIHDFGLSEVERLGQEMRHTMRATGFDGTLTAFLQQLRNDPALHPHSANELLREAAWIAKRVDGRIGRYIGHLPRQPFAIEPVPDELAPFYTGGRGGPGMYLLNTYDLPSRTLFTLTALTLHEASPGHALQMALANEMHGLPAFRRLVHLPAYTEGWALYAERLGVEMGMYETTHDHFGYLTFQVWRAARLVVDTGLHQFGWSREKARAYLRDHTAMGEHEITTEVDRYISWPGQALSYYLGQMQFVHARAMAEQSLGEKFDLRAFHDTVLATGSVPLPVLRQCVERFIAEVGHASPATRTGPD